MAGPIYEVNLAIDVERASAFDEWLAHHVEEMLKLPGFEHAEVFRLENDEGKARRVAHYHLESGQALDEYLAGPAEQMRQSGIDRFGEALSATRRVLSPDEISDGRVRSTEPCLNCGELLSGQYCAACGQRARSGLISLWELVRDAFGDLFEIDSRLWQTLVPLLVRPGKLTADYLRGRRARFMPPFRTYLVLSLVFFFIALFDPRENFGLLFEPKPEETEELQTQSSAWGR